MKIFFLSSFLFFSALYIGCAQDNPPFIETPTEINYTYEIIVDGIDIPWGLVFITEKDFLVTEKSGILYRVVDGEKTAVTGIPDVYVRGQGGLLDIALHPDFASNSVVYITLSTANGGDEKGGNTSLYSAKLNGNGLEEDVLEEANLEEIETVLALTNDDEDNLMVSVLVEKFSQNKRTMALINKPNYSLLQSSLKIDDLIDPRMNTVSSILKHVHKGTIETAYSILNGEYEVIEADIIETSELINKELKNSNLPDEIRIGAILRGDDIIIPRSNFIFQKDDVVVFLAKRDQLPTVESMFRISAT